MQLSDLRTLVTVKSKSTKQTGLFNSGESEGIARGMPPEVQNTAFLAHTCILIWSHEKEAKSLPRTSPGLNTIKIIFRLGLPWILLGKLIALPDP